VPIPRSIIGRSTAPVTHELDAGWLTGFAASVGERSPAYFDTDRTGGVVAHPLFPVCVEWAAVTAAARLDDGALRDDERRRGIHATHDLTIHRLLRAGDVLTTTATVDALEPHPRGTLERLRLDTRDAAGSLVASTVMGSLFLGVTIQGAAARGDATEPPRDRRDHAARDPSAASLVEIAVSADRARVYSEASRIWNPIHTDAAAAVAAGLPAPILHGTCTLAMATSAALASQGVADPDAPRRIRARFAGMVRMPSSLELRVTRPAARELHFDVFGPDGGAVIRDGVLTL
jgi:acyl dehydratase